MRRVYLLSIFILLIQFNGLSTDFKWKVVTSPYRNYIYPGQTGLQYNLTYSYSTEAKALRNYLKANYNVRSSESISRIFKDISTGVYFERYFDMKIKYIKSVDTLMLVVKYENGDSTLEKFTNINGTTKIYIPLTKYKMQHDYSIGRPKSPKQKGLVTSVNVFVSSKRRTKSHVSVLTKLITEADMPGIISKIKGRSVLK